MPQAAARAVIMEAQAKAAAKLREQLIREEESIREAQVDATAKHAPWISLGAEWWPNLAVEQYSASWCNSCSGPETAVPPWFFTSPHVEYSGPEALHVAATAAATWTPYISPWY